ncbi:hypothetical protein [Nostoc sp.]|uniref:hypothetical protein n=1 Tax=Nostoc sp. TaxID=1180 RepID=UPI002FFD4D2B
MSLTSFLEIPDVKAKFKAEFPKPKFDIKRELLAPQILGVHPRLVGTAFDYLLRFYAKYLNPQPQEDEWGWVAEGALKVLKRQGENQLYELANVAVAEARRNYLNFLSYFYMIPKELPVGIVVLSLTVLTL